MHDRTGKEDFVKIAVIILTHNEEAHIGACIRSAAFADEILVIDDESEDRTREIAAEAGARVISHLLAGDFAAQRNFALTQTTADWVLYLDADERVRPAAGETMRRIAEENPKAAYEIKRVNIAFGQKMRYGGHRPDLCLRFFPMPFAGWGLSMSVPIRSCPCGGLRASFTTTHIRAGIAIFKNSTNTRR